MVCKASPQALGSYFLTSFFPASTELRLGCSQQTESSKPMQLLLPTTTIPLEETAAELGGNMSTFLLGSRFRQAFTKTASETFLCQRKLKKKKKKSHFFISATSKLGLASPNCHILANSACICLPGRESYHAKPDISIWLF